MITLIIKNPDKIIFEGEARNFSSYNKKGKFDVLTDHENFISIVEKYIIIRPRSGPEQYINLDNGILKVKGNKAQLYIGIKR